MARFDIIDPIVLLLPVGTWAALFWAAFTIAFFVLGALALSAHSGAAAAVFGAIGAAGIPFQVVAWRGREGTHAG